MLLDFLCLLFFCQITFLGFGMDVVANISCYVCVKIPWKNLEHQYFFSFLNSWARYSRLSNKRACWLNTKLILLRTKTSSTLLNQLTVSWVKILRPSDEIISIFGQNFYLSAHCPHRLKWLLLVPINVSSHDL